jgi:glycosyltransferase involved in cell wall biosynthesis
MGPGSENGVLRGHRALFVLDSLELGGAERQALHLAAYLQTAQGMPVEVWGTGPGRASAMCDQQGIPWRIVVLPRQWEGRWEMLKGTWRFAHKIRAARAEILMPYTFYPNLICGLAWKWSGARTCIWNQRDEGRGFDDRRPLKLALRLTPHFISNSKHAADLLASRVSASAGRIHVIRNGVAPAAASADRQAWRARLEASEDCFLACMIANLHTAKDHPTLLKAWNIVVERLKSCGRDAVLLLAGRLDCAAAAVKALAFDLNMGRNVRFLGPVDDVGGLLGAVDLSVLSSVLEGVPNALLESMAAGLPVVATDIPGIREAVGEDNYANLAAPGDVRGLAERIVVLAMDREMALRQGAANRRRIEREFTLDRMCVETARVLCRCLAE